MSIDQKTLAELREKLESEKKRIEGELERFTHENSDGDREANFPKDLGNERSENATEVEEYTDRLGVEQSLEAQLKDITDALERMENGTYGIDEKTGEEINIERLRVYPAARTNV